MKTLITLFTLMLIGASTVTSQPRFCVQKDGLQPPGYDEYFTSIMAAVNRASAPGTLIKVFPHPTPYEEKVVIAKDIIVEGSGAEATTISNQNRDFAVDISAGKIRWFRITSQGTGAKVSGAGGKGGIITNCVASDCSWAGFDCYGGGKVLHCLSINNLNGFYIPNRNETPIITNCIAYKNVQDGFSAPTGGSQWFKVEFNTSFANGSRNWRESFGGITLGAGNIEQDPKLNEGSYGLSASSPCNDAGNSAYKDPDSTNSDMGYYGGPEAPTFPVMIKAIPTLNPDGTITIEATGVSRY